MDKNCNSTDVWNTTNLEKRSGEHTGWLLAEFTEEILTKQQNVGLHQSLHDKKKMLNIYFLHTIWSIIGIKSYSYVCKKLNMFYL